MKNFFIMIFHMYKANMYFYTYIFHLQELPKLKMKFSIKDFFSKCDQIRRKLRIWSHLLKKSLMENLIFCVFKHTHFLSAWESQINRTGYRLKQCNNQDLYLSFASFLFPFCFPYCRCFLLSTLFCSPSPILLVWEWEVVPVFLALRDECNEEL